MFCIVEAHWSKDIRDSHQQDDADCTYIAHDKYGRFSQIFSKLSDVLIFLKNTRA